MGNDGTIGASIVLYQSDEKEVKNAVDICLACEDVRFVYLIDNSPTPSNWEWLNHASIIYKFANANLGYGTGHNIALRELVEKVEYSLILNSDVQFDPKILSNLRDVLLKNSEISAVGPKIYYDDGKLQHSIKMLPTPLNLIARRFFLFGGLFPTMHKYAPNFMKLRIKTIWDKLINCHENIFELLITGYNERLAVQSVSGCFVMVRSSSLKEINFFDERYFMYGEDVDLSRRLAEVGSVVFVPEVEIIHSFRKTSYSDKNLGRHHIQSMIKYFNKWGWVFDPIRSIKNAELKSKINN